ncbi:MAG: hypothetical protein U0451_02765 [Candidatus Saccharimonadales bacterium]
MKSKDLVALSVIVVIAGVISYFVSKQIFVKKNDTKQQVKVVETIETKFDPPSKQYFNNQSVNPTQPIQIGDK